MSQCYPTIVEDDYSHSSALMLARLLQFAIADFDDLGMAEVGEEIETCFNALVTRFQLQPDELYHPKGIKLQ